MIIFNGCLLTRRYWKKYCKWQEAKYGKARVKEIKKEAVVWNEPIVWKVDALSKAWSEFIKALSDFFLITHFVNWLVKKLDKQ